jgi:hypothetical protein
VAHCETVDELVEGNGDARNVAAPNKRRLNAVNISETIRRGAKGEDTVQYLKIVQQ